MNKRLSRNAFTLLLGLVFFMAYTAKAAQNSSIVQITGADHFERLLAQSQQEKKLLVVDFFATWCPICTSMKPLFEKFAKGGKKRAFFARVDIDKHKALVTSHKALAEKIHGVPTFVYFRDGKEVGRIVGSTKLRHLRAGLKRPEKLKEQATFSALW